MQLYVPAIVPLTGTFTVNPVVRGDVGNGCPVAAELAEGGTEQLVGAALIGVANITAADVAAEIDHVPARTGIAAAGVVHTCEAEQYCAPVPPAGQATTGLPPTYSLAKRATPFTMLHVPGSTNPYCDVAYWLKL